MRNMSENNLRKKPLNLNLTPRLRRYVEEFVRINERKSAVAVIEEALREFFKARNIDVDAPADEILRSIVEDDRKSKRGKHA